MDEEIKILEVSRQGPMRFLLPFTDDVAELRGAYAFVVEQILSGPHFTSEEKGAAATLISLLLFGQGAYTGAPGVVMGRGVAVFPVRATGPHCYDDPDTIFAVGCIRHGCTYSVAFPKEGLTPAKAIEAMLAAGWRQHADPFREAQAEHGDPTAEIPIPAFECPRHG